MMKEKVMKKKIVFILGTHFCGSTLLGNALNGHIAFSHLGEIHRLYLFENLELNKALGMDTLYGCRVCQSNNNECTFWSENFLNDLERENFQDKYLNIIKNTKEKVVIDSSKFIEWFLWCRNVVRDIYDIKVIIMCRNPFGFALSWKGASNQAAWQGAEIWRNTYRNILCVINGNSIPNIIVRYEDFSYNPDEVLKDIVQFLGEEYSESLCSYWERSVHAIGGNTAAYFRYNDFNPDDLIKPRCEGENVKDETWKPQYYENKPFGGWCSDRWMRELRDNEIQEILGIPMVADMGMLLGYNLVGYVMDRIRS